MSVPTPPKALRFLTLLIAAACGAIVANIYYAQTLAGPIAEALHLSQSAAGLVVAAAQVGYVAGLLFLVPLSDLTENRRLVVVLIACAAVALGAAALATQAAPFLAASLAIGATSVAAQVLVAYAAHLAPDASRGRVVGSVMSGLMIGIMLSRPAASFLAHVASWRLVFAISAVGMLALAAALARLLPARTPATTMRYGALLASMRTLARTTPVFQQRALYHTFLFGAFNLFWTTTPLVLARGFHLSQAGIALFALVGVAGAVAAPVGGRLADRGLTLPASIIAMVACIVAFALTRLAPIGTPAALALFTVAAVVLDAGATMHLVVSQRLIFSVGAEVRGRLNGLFMATFFVGGALGSAVGAWSFASGGWQATSWIGAALPTCALACYGVFLARRARRRRATAEMPENTATPA
jgi:predicted MFS family arabinose efflux permease